MNYWREGYYFFLKSLKEKRIAQKSDETEKKKKDKHFKNHLLCVVPVRG